MRTIMTSATLALLASTAMAQSPYEALPSADSLPEDVVQLTPTIPGMGEHWANPADMPLGPIYCVHQGKIICLEFMIAQADFEAGESWPTLAGMDGLPPVNHTNMSFEAHGHEGFEDPHYDIHLFFLSPEEVAKVQPD